MTLLPGPSASSSSSSSSPYPSVHSRSALRTLLRTPVLLGALMLVSALSFLAISTRIQRGASFPSSSSSSSSPLGGWALGWGRGGGPDLATTLASLSAALHAAMADESAAHEGMKAKTRDLARRLDALQSAIVSNAQNTSLAVDTLVQGLLGGVEDAAAKAVESVPELCASAIEIALDARERSRLLSVSSAILPNFGKGVECAKSAAETGEGGSGGDEGGAEGYRRRRAGPRSAIIGLSRGLAVTEISLFVRSARRHMSSDDVDIILFLDVESVSPELEFLIKQYDVIAVPYALENFPETIRGFHPSSYRWILFREYMRLAEKKVGYNVDEWQERERQRDERIAKKKKQAHLQAALDAALQEAQSRPPPPPPPPPPAPAPAPDHREPEPQPDPPLSPALQRQKEQDEMKAAVDAALRIARGIPPQLDNAPPPGEGAPSHVRALLEVPEGGGGGGMGAVELDDVNLLRPDAASTAGKRRSSSSKGAAGKRGNAPDGRPPYEHVFFCDVRDTAFQSDVFLANKGRKGFVAFLEHKVRTIGDCGWNSKWVSDCFGQEGLDRVASNWISCSGTSLSTWDDGMTYVSMVAEQLAGNPKCENNGVDQGIHNYFLHSGKLVQSLTAVTVDENESGFVATVQLMPVVTLDRMGRLLNDKAEPVAVIHQYDRVDELKMTLNNEYPYFGIEGMRIERPM
jgi:hypothetical protein